VASQRTTPIEYWVGIQALIESVLPPDWLASNKAASHPARFDWEFSKLMQRQEGSLGYPSQRRLLPQHGRLMLDMFTWMNAIPGSDPNSFRIGNVEGYGDPRVAGKLMSELRNPRAYSDWMVELLIAGTHRSAGRSVTPYEDDGFPDLRIDVPGGALFAECKRLYELGENRLRSVVKKANAQIRRAAEALGSPHEGTIVLDLNGGRRLRFGSSEWTPPDVADTVALVQRALSGDKNRSVRRAYVLWDDFSYHGSQPGRTLVAYSRRYEIVEHRGEARGQDIGIRTFSGSTAAALLVWTPKAKRG
jgi:hypothetical protein